MSDTPITSTGADMTFPAVRKSWALIDGGFVVELRVTNDAFEPFGLAAEGKRVIDVTGVPCQLGYVADSKGNVAPPPPDGRPLLGHEPAYHDRSASVPVVAPPAEPGAEQSEGVVDGMGEFKAAHPTAGLVQEGPAKSETDPAVETPATQD